MSVEAVAAPGYQFAGWGGDASGVSAQTTVHLDGNKSVTAHFVPSAYSVRVAADPDDRGYIITGAGTYFHGEEAILTVVLPTNGISTVGGDASGKENPLRLTITGDTNIIAHFSYGIPETMSRIPGGKFAMGNPATTKNPEGPAHIVEVDAFYIGKTEVTKGDWDRVCLGRTERVHL